MPQDLDELFDGLREDGGERMWGAGVKLARAGAVEGVSDDGDEIKLWVKAPDRAVRHEVFLWPVDADYGCDCGRDGACVHACAAAIAMRQGLKIGGAALPEPSATYKVRLRYAFKAAGTSLSLVRHAVWPDGRIEPVKASLTASGLTASRGDLQVESLLVRMQYAGGRLTPDLLRRLLIFLEADAPATLDGDPIRTSPEYLPFRVVVGDDGEGFKLGLFRPLGVDRLFRGAALIEGVLRPTSHGSLTADQRSMLVKGVAFRADEVGRLVSEMLPALRERIPVDIQTSRLPREDALVPRVRMSIAEAGEGLRVSSALVYGDPPVARVTTGGALQALSTDVVPARDRDRERVVTRQWRDRFGRPVGFDFTLPPDEAAEFLRERLPLHDGPVVGKVDPARFRVTDRMVTPTIDVARTTRPTGRDGEENAWQLSVQFDDGDGRGADPLTVLAAWRSGRSVVRLMDGGYAPLPTHWLREHGALLRELLEARDGSDRVDRHATAALVELLEDTSADVPVDLRRLRGFLEGGDGLPDVPPPDTLVADLRPYQLAGFQWLRFLREMDLNGVLADDMGLGKTVQAIAAMCDIPGPHLVVAPTSVLRNWEKELNRFAPSKTVSVFHGRDRALDDSDVTLTSYALLRLDLDMLRERNWSYVVLDEAQAIKNPGSQTARAACALPGAYRLALTGTPVENRLEELWSLFKFLMPGLLGGRSAFKDRFVKPIEVGDARARKQLRNRVRPYVLRRLKKQVASELPPLTEVVVRCTMGADQRKVYDTVRMAVRQDVQAAIQTRGERGATMQVLEALLRMRQACCDPDLLPGDVGLGVSSAKLDRMEELLVEIVTDDHKALVFSQWTSLLDRAGKRLDELGIPFVRLDGSTRDRQAVIDTFQSDEGPPVFLLSLKAGGTGLNLTAADYVLHLDPWWNPAVERQATDRAHRIGQDRPVVSCRLIAEDTVEERILELQDAKRDLADAALGTEGGFVKALSSRELRGLFDAA
ncbi:MAG: superfamily II DNA or RNA helicase [Myxococcota bacterium]